MGRIATEHRNNCLCIHGVQYLIWRFGFEFHSGTQQSNFCWGSVRLYSSAWISYNSGTFFDHLEKDLFRIYRASLCWYLFYDLEFVPLELSQLVRSTQFSYTSINLSRPIGSILTNYQTSAFFSSFILASFTGQLELQIFVLPYAAGSTTINFKLYSGNSHSNVYPKICFTFIIIDVSTFSYQVSTYVATYQKTSLVYPSIAITPNFGIPSNFNPSLN